MTAPFPQNEGARLRALRDCHVLDTPPEDEFEDITRLAAHLCGVPIAAVSLIDAERQWFKSIVGLAVEETPRDVAFCAHTILQDAVMVVPDAQGDPRFAHNPLVTGDPNIRFYAGAPLVTEDGHALGSLCVIDRRPRQLSPDQQETLRLLGRLVTNQLEKARRVAERERAEAERLEIDAERLRLAAIIETSDDAVYSATRTGRVTTWNRGAERLYGYDAAQIIGRRVYLLVPPDRRDEMKQLLAAAARGEASAPLETVRLTKTGAQVDVSLRVSPLMDAGGGVVGVSMIARDITQRRRAEAALEAEREFTGALLESLQEGIAACDAGGTLTLFNRAARELHGLPAEPLPPDQWAEHFDLYAPDGLTPLATEDIPLVRALRGETVRDARMVVAPASDPPRTLLASGQAIWDGAGRKLGAVVAMHDITDRCRAERELARLAAIVESCEEAILAATLDGTIVGWNRGAERLYGYGAAEIVGRNTSVLTGGAGPGPVPAVVTRLLRGEMAAPVEVTRTRRDGTEFHAVLSFSPIRDAAGQLVGLSAIARDITAQKRAEAALAETHAALSQSHAALAESEARLRRLTDAAFEGIAISQNGVLVDVNPAFAALFGCKEPAEMVGTGAAQLCALHSRALVLQKIADGDERPYEAVLQRQDGTTFPAEVRARQTLMGGRPARVSAVRDISEQRAMEEALRESQRFARSVSENSASLIWVFDLDTKTNVYANRSLGDLLGYAPEKAPAPGAELLATVIHPEDFPGLLAHFAEFQHALDDQVVEFEYRARHADGGWRWLWNRDVVFERHADGRPRRILGNAQDVTAQKALEADLRAQAERLRRSEAALRAVLESAPVILYAADAGGTVTLSEGMGLAALGLKPGEAVGRSVLDFSGGDAALEANTRRALAGEAVSSDVDVHGLWLHTELRPLMGADGAPSGLIGVCFDVTARVASEERFRVLFERSSDAHLLVDESGIVDCNAAAVTLLRCADKAQLLSLHPATLSPEFQPDGRRSGEKGHAMEAVARKSGFHRFEWMHHRLDGEEFPVEVALTPVTLADRPVMLAVLHDLTERKRAEETVRDHAVVLEFQKQALEQANAELEALATTDGMTGLKNHRAFQEQLVVEVSRAGRYHTPLSLVLVDVDHFKGFNDAFGHPAGDAVLRAVAALLQTSARETDFVARYGGEEFVLLLPQTDTAGASLFAERLRASLEAAPWPLRAVTASFGVASLRLGVEDGGSLLTRADEALYRSKAGGRNQVTASGGPALPVSAG